MKKIITAVLIIICVSVFAMPVIAQKEDKIVHAGITIAAGMNETSSFENLEKGHGADKAANITAATRETQSGTGEDKRTNGRTIFDVRDNIRKERGDLNATLQNLSDTQRERIKNQNEVRIAVHSLLEMENLSGGIGPEVSAIARDFNNSARSSQMLEDRIQARNSILRLFLGGNQSAAGELLNLTAQNQARIQQMQQLMNSTSLDPDVKTTMEDQITVLQNELARLEQLAAHEKQDHGLFGWL
ncbi:MAG: hypothetical protein ABSE07_06900 [Methanoregula sp.]|jgi:hypothetical protein